MNWDAINWASLDRLRTAFLDGTAGVRDYWLGERDLDSYDQTFAQRIGWKWDYVLRELQRRGWSPAPGEALDWGCGTGIAGRKFLEYFGHSVAALGLWDRSERAMRFAEEKARSIFPTRNVRVSRPSATGTLLLSHVLTELSGSQFAELLALAGEARAILWIEPGTHTASRKLIEVRERLRGAFRVIAPCTHEAACGMRAAGNDRHWCHHFAPSPPAVFTDGHWARFAALAGVDLRSLPLSFLVLDKRPPPALPSRAMRIIGGPRVYKAHASVLGCDANGVHDRRLSKRRLPAEFRAWKKGRIDALQSWECEGDEIERLQPLPPS